MANESWSISRSILPIKKPQTFSSEPAPCMVEDKVKNNGKPISVAEIDESLKLVHITAEMLLFKRRKPVRLKQFIRAGEIGREAILTYGKRHFGREVIGAVVPQTEVAREFLNRHQLQH